MLTHGSKTTTFRRGDPAYLRLRVHGFDVLDGKEQAIVRAIDINGEFIAGEIWYYCDPSLLIAGRVVQQEIADGTIRAPETAG